MRYSGIGGQAVMEGVMMKNQEKYAVAVRKPNQEIVVEVSEYTGLVKSKKIKNIPILRGVINFIESLVLGMKTLTFSASFFEDEEEEKEGRKKKAKKQEDAMMGGTVLLSIVLAVAIFMILPYYISLFFQKFLSEFFTFFPYTNITHRRP